MSKFLDLLLLWHVSSHIYIYMRVCTDDKVVAILMGLCHSIKEMK